MTADTSKQPDLGTVLELIVEIAMSKTKTHTVARVTAYDSDLQQVSVQPLIKYATVDELKRPVAKAEPELHNVPVAFSGTSISRITHPIKIGDLCLVAFCHSSLDIWKQIGGGPVDPKDYRTHDLSDGVAIFGVYDAAHLPTDAPGDAVVWHVDDAYYLRLGDMDADQSVIRGDAFLSALNTMLTAFSTADGALATAITEFQTHTNFLSSKVKVK